MPRSLTLQIIEGEPYHGVLELVDTVNGVETLRTLPLGVPRMQIRRRVTDAAPLVDLGVLGYITRTNTALVIDLPRSVTAALPDAAVWDAWAGETRIAEGDVNVDRSVTRWS